MKNIKERLWDMGYRVRGFNKYLIRVLEWGINGIR